jgi:hypothetical protein
VCFVPIARKNHATTLLGKVGQRQHGRGVDKSNWEVQSSLKGPFYTMGVLDDLSLVSSLIDSPTRSIALDVSRADCLKQAPRDSGGSPHWCDSAFPSIWSTASALRECDPFSRTTPAASPCNCPLAPGLLVMDVSLRWLHALMLLTNVSDKLDVCGNLKLVCSATAAILKSSGFRDGRGTPQICGRSTPARVQFSKAPRWTTPKAYNPSYEPHKSRSKPKI